MFEILDLVTTRFSSLLLGMSFDEDKNNTKVAMQMLKLGMQPKAAVQDQQEHPFTTFKILRGEDAPADSKIYVELITGLYVNPDTDSDGTDNSVADHIEAAGQDMKTIVTAYRSLAEDGNYSPYSLEGMTWQVGDKDGLHPSQDYYELRAVLVFIQPPVF